MKLVVIGPTYPFKGGISHYNTVLCENLAKRHEVKLISYKRQYPQLLIRLLFKAKEQTEKSSEKEIKFPNKPLIDSINPLTWVKTLAEIKRINPDLVLMYWWTPYWTFFNYFISTFSKTKTLCICHNVIPHEGSFLDKILTKIALRNLRFFIVHSKSDEKELKQILPHSVSQIHPHPIYDVFDVGKIRSKEEARKLLNLKGNVILFFGYVRKYKGLDHLIKALPEVLKKVDLKLLIVGQFWEKEEYLELIKKLDLEEKIVIIDDYVPNEDVEKYFKAADVVVLPYNSATTSGIIQIAFAFNKPVIATNIGGLPEIVLDNKTGYITPVKNIETLAEAIIKFYKEDKEKEFVENIEKNKKRFSWESMVESIEAFVK